MKKKKNTLNIVNCYAPHVGTDVGTAKKDITIARQFYKDLDMAFQIFSGQDVIVLGDFNCEK